MWQLIDCTRESFTYYMFTDTSVNINDSIHQTFWFSTVAI